jgi:hypothetical protein
MRWDDTGELIGAALALRRRGFLPQETGRLAPRRRHAERRAPREAPAVPPRWRFVRWLVERGRLSDQLPSPAAARPAEGPDGGAHCGGGA